MGREALRAFLMLAVLTVLTGLVYPLAVTGLGQVLFPIQANGSIVEQGGRSVGSHLIGQSFSGAQYFHSRPSAAGKSGYDPLASGGSNLGPTNSTLLATIKSRITAIRHENGLTSETTIPNDLVTASASGLDPDISPDAAFLQVEHVSQARGLPEQTVRDLVTSHIRPPQLRLLGPQRVNVLELNMALDKLGSLRG